MRDDIWTRLDRNTEAFEIPGVGCVIAYTNTLGVGACFVPGTRIRGDTITREDRKTPPLVEGKSAAEIRAAQPLVVDPPAMNYLVLDEEAAEY